MNKHIIINTEDLYYYLKDIKKIPVITHKRQEEIFEQLKNNNISKEEKECLEKELVTGNLRFVITVAKAYQNQGLDILDLISEGNIGLLKAIQRFDYSSGVKFISYAVWWIKQSMLSALNDYSRTIRIPSNLIQESQKERRCNESDIGKIGATYGTTLPYCSSLFDEINEDKDRLIDLVRDPNEDNPENILNTKDEIRKKVNLMLGVLDEREKTIIEKYFGLNGIESNLEDLGLEFNCTKERIRQLKDKAIKKLRNESFTLFEYL